MTASCPDLLPDAAAAEIKDGFSHLLFTTVNDCVTCPVELAPSHRCRNEVLLPLSFQSVFQHFCLQRVSLLYEYQVTSALGWLPAKLHIGCVAKEPSSHCLHKDLCQVGFSTEML